MAENNISGVEAIRQLIEAQKNWHVFRAKKENDKNTMYIGDTALTEEELISIKTGSQTASEGIAYTLSEDGTYAICTGRDGFTGTSLVIASEYQGKPVTHIGESAFADVDHKFPDLINIVLPDTIMHIGNFAFQICGLQTINIPNSVTYLGDGAFYENPLVSIAIPDSVTSIGGEAFFYCTSLTSITIPDSVTSISGDVFYGCENLTIYCEAKAQPEGWHSNWNPDNRPVIWDYASDIPAINDKIISVENNIGDIETALDAILAIQEELIGGDDPESDLITFTIDGTEYTAIEGITWGEWCESDYNTIGAYNTGVEIRIYTDMERSLVNTYDGFGVNPTDTIQAYGVYSFLWY